MTRYVRYGDVCGSMVLVKGSGEWCSGGENGSAGW